MPKIKLISFDFDGVIVKGFNTWFKIRELKEIPEGRYEDFKKGLLNGLEFRESEHILYKEANLCKQDFIEVARIQESTPNVKELINKLHKRGIILAINSAGPKLTIETKLKLEKIDFFKYICSMIPLFDENDLFYDTDVPYLDSNKMFDKVKPLEIFAKKENLKFDEIIHIGDGINDVAAFKKCIGVGYNVQSRKLRETADYIIDDLLELLTLVDNL